MNTVTAKPVESHADVLLRHLRKAQAEGIRLVMEGESEAWYATSATMEHVIYRVTERGCSCAGFTVYGRCKHHALYLERFGLRPPTAQELADIRAEWLRQRSLFTRNQIKSTADWWNYQEAQRRYRQAVRLTGVVECENCGNEGTIDRKDHNGDRWTVTCPVCHGEGISAPAPLLATAAD